MAGLFDAIRGAMMVMGGYGDTRREEVKSKSEADYRKGVLEQGERKIASEESIAASQRELSEKLQGKAIASQEGMQKSEQQVRKELQMSDQEFRTVEGEFGRDFALKLEQMRIKAGVDLHKMDAKSRFELQEADIKFRRESMLIDQKLRERGMTIQEALAKGTVTHQNAGILLEAIKLSYPKGLEALYDSTIAPDQKAKMQAEGDAKFASIMKSVDPENKLGLKSIKASDIVKPAGPQAPVRSSGFTPPPGAVQPIQGVPSQSLPPGPSTYNNPALGGLSFTPNAPPALSPGGIPPYRQATSFGTEPLRADLDPQDTFRLQSIAAFATKQPNPQEALQRGLEFIQSPESSFAGHSKLTDPRQVDFYNKAAGFELQNMFNKMNGQ